MSFFDLLKMVGGLALFLYGMNLLGDGLSRASGGRLERILEKLTNNPLKAVLMGAVVTGVIQSSSATTVMVVGFVNSGIMSLKQAVGIIMGAHKYRYDARFADRKDRKSTRLNSSHNNQSRMPSSA